MHPNILMKSNIFKTRKRSACSAVDVHPQTLGECIISLQRKAGLHILEIALEWNDTPRMSIDVRRKHALMGVLRERKKQRFDYNKLLTVYVS
jgi:hypothetical protein